MYRGLRFVILTIPFYSPEESRNLPIPYIPMNLFPIRRNSQTLLHNYRQRLNCCIYLRQRSAMSRYVVILVTFGFVFLMQLYDIVRAISFGRKTDRNAHRGKILPSGCGTNMQRTASY